MYVNPNGDCGKQIKTSKFHSSHKQFGPHHATSIYKSIVQSFIDCAVNRLEVFKLVPDGKSSEVVRLKTTNYNEKKTLTKIENLQDMWQKVKEMCKLLHIDDAQLFSNKVFNSNSTNKSTNNDLIRNNKPTESNATSTTAATTSNETLPLTPQASSSSSASSTSSSSSSSCSNSSYIENNKNPNDTTRNDLNAAQKRRSSASSNILMDSQNENKAPTAKLNEFDNANSTFNHSKIYKIDSSLEGIPSKSFKCEFVVGSN